MCLQPLSESGYYIDLQPSAARGLASLPGDARAIICERLRAIVELALVIEQIHPLGPRGASEPPRLSLELAGCRVSYELDPEARVLAVHDVRVGRAGASPGARDCCSLSNSTEGSPIP